LVLREKARFIEALFDLFLFFLWSALFFSIFEKVYGKSQEKK